MGKNEDLETPRWRVEVRDDSCGDDEAYIRFFPVDILLSEVMNALDVWFPDAFSISFEREDE